MSIDLVLIRRFEAVHRLGSFSRAADELAITHSAITKSIRTLEESWNVRLFERTTRSITPTEAGRRLALAAADLLAYSEGVKADVLAGGRQLNVICGPAVFDSFIHGALIEFRTVYPDVSVHIETMPPEIACDQLFRRHAQLLLFHAGTVAGLQRRKELSVEKLVSEPYHVVYRPGHPVEGTDQSLRALLDFDWAIAGFDNSYQAGLPTAQRALFRQRGFPKYRLLNQSACVELAMLSDVLTLLPATAAAPHVASGRFAAMPFPGGASFSISAVTAAAIQPSVTNIAFVEALRRSLSRSAGTPVAAAAEAPAPG